MRNFLLLVGKLFLILILINILLYFWIGHAENSRFYNYYDVINNIDKKHYKYLVTGDSHANDCWHHNDDPNVLDFSFPGDNQIDIQRKISFLNKNKITYDTHLYEVDAQVLTSYRETTNNNDLSLLYDGYLAGIKVRTFLPLFFNPRAWTDMLNQIKPSKEEIDQRLNTIIDTSKIIVRANEQFLKEKFSPKMLEIMRTNIEITHNQNAKISLIHYPFYDTYLDLIEDSGAFKGSIESTKQIAKEMNLQLFDFTRLICKPIHFSNQDHLNSKGSKMFLAQLISCFDNSSCEITCID